MCLGVMVCGVAQAHAIKSRLLCSSPHLHGTSLILQGPVVRKLLVRAWITRI